MTPAAREDGLLRPGERQRDFPRLAHCAYLDTATKGVPPERAVAALGAETARWASGTADHSRWETAAEQARTRVAPLLGAHPHDVALLPSHVAAASTVAHGLPDATVLVPEAEYRSNLLPWTAGRERVRLIPSPATTETICTALDTGADLLALSSVQSLDGLRVDLARVVRHAHRRGTLVYVDASQSLGVDTALATCGADFIGAVAYKWLLGTRGAAFLMLRPEHHTRFAPLLSSPQSARDIAEGAHHGAHYRPFGDARRFDQPPAWLAWTGTAAALHTLTRYQAHAVEEHATTLAGHFRDAAAGIGLTPGPLDLPSPVVSLRHPAPRAALTALAGHRVRAAARPGTLRFAFHLYTTEADVERALTALHTTTA